MKTTIIFFEAPHRILGTIEEMIEVFGEDQEIVFARELTKIYEEVLHFTLGKAKKYFTHHAPKGEFVILFQIGR